MQNIFDECYEVAKKINNVEIIFEGIKNFRNYPCKIGVQNNKYYLSFSKFYLNNSKEKIKNCILKYMLLTTKDYKFKTYNELKETIIKHKLNYLLPTLNNQYLQCSYNKKTNCICDKCFSLYNLNLKYNYKCFCGGNIRENLTYNYKGEC